LNNFSAKSIIVFIKSINNNFVGKKGMIMLKSFLSLCKSDITVIKSNKEDSSIVKNIVKFLSKGNVNLQKGNYITSSTIKKKQNEIFSYRFSL